MMTHLQNSSEKKLNILSLGLIFLLDLIKHLVNRYTLRYSINCNY